MYQLLFLQLTLLSPVMVKIWDDIKSRYDIAFVAATFAITFGLAFIFFTMVVSDWMFPSPYADSVTPTINTSLANNTLVNNALNETDN